FAADFDGFLIDVAELTELLLGMDATNVRVKPFFDDKHPAVVAFLEMAVSGAQKLRKPVGMVNLPPGALAHYAGLKVVHQASYLTFRPEVLPSAREELLQGQARAR
ncbi:MAG TPA: putative PEP-binding protein, partial [bacterium]|nr:putative PEP-binding protein [bacterium]